jgi:trans-2,3-dihydro-3-hydroxyanthranilate isomerase
MAAYLMKHELITERRFIAEQGHWMGRPGQAWVEVLGDAREIDSVVVSGRAVTVVRGSLLL